MSASPCAVQLEEAPTTTRVRHLTVVPDAPTSPPGRRQAVVARLPPDLMWLALVGPIGLLGVFGLLSWWLIAELGVGVTVALYAGVVLVAVATGQRWAR